MSIDPTLVDVRARRSPAQAAATLLADRIGSLRSTRRTVVSVPAPRLHAAQVFALNGDAFVFAAPNGDAADATRVTGFLNAATFHASGPDRFSEIRNALASWYEETELAHPDGPELRAFGGFAFAEGAASEAAWAPFGDAAFVIPKYAYHQSASGGDWLSVVVEPKDDRRAMTEQARKFVRALERRASEALPSLRRVEHEPEVHWVRMIEDAQEAIRAGDLKKVVCARRTSLELDEHADLAEVVHTIQRRFPECHTFAFRKDRSVFVAATPERLVRRNQRTVLTEALAGSVAPEEAEATAKLLSSRKDLAEHDFVVRDILARLAPLCVELDAGELALRRLPNVIHLQTPIAGTLSKDTHILDLVGALHPTPAVGGVPVDRALAFVSREEAEPRGWYSGPVGWVDARGDGEFAVALRSGLFRSSANSDGTRVSSAWLYGGAGIVERSEPEREYRETGWKLKALLDLFSHTG
ncbi:MAG: isochorismate synthase [Myxococcota bacterium]